MRLMKLYSQLLENMKNSVNYFKKPKNWKTYQGPLKSRQNFFVISVENII